MGKFNDLFHHKYPFITDTHCQLLYEDNDMK